MRRMHRIVLLVALIAIAPVLAGCEGFDHDKFDIFSLNDKKKLKGERKELFPEGVPGVTQGLAPEYVNKQQQPANAQTPAAVPANTAAGAPNDKAAAPAQPGKTAAVEPVEEPKPKAKPKRKPKPRTAARRPTPVTVQPAAQKQNGGQQQPSPWPDQNRAQSSSPAQGQSTSTAPWPPAPPPGTFSR
jgi:hypothetical protein